MADKLREAAQQALEALKYMHDEKCDYMRRNNLGDPLREHAARLALPAIEALEAALAQAEPVQEPNYFGLTKDHTWLSVSKEQYDKLKPQGRMACIIRSEK
jgi:hypothetical protein